MVYSKTQLKIIYESLYHYLKYKFPYGYSWTNPISAEVFHYDEIIEVLEYIKTNNLVNYTHLQYLWLDKLPFKPLGVFLKTIKHNHKQIKILKTFRDTVKLIINLFNDEQYLTR